MSEEVKLSVMWQSIEAELGSDNLNAEGEFCCCSCGRLISPDDYGNINYTVADVQTEVCCLKIVIECACGCKTTLKFEET